MSFVFAIGSGDMGAKALYLFVLWLMSAAAASWLAERKGYGQKPGLAAGLLLSAVGALLWLIWPARKDSKWKLQGWFRNSSGKTVAEARAEMHQDESQ
jgi:fucose permease